MLKKIIKIIGWIVAVLVLLIAGLALYAYVDGRPHHGRAQYVALGSSFASGPTITQRADDSPRFCGRSSDNYAHQLARLRGLSLVDVSCGGSNTHHVLDGGQFLQPAQVSAVTAETELVTLTIGGNDINYMGNLIAYGCDAQTRGWFRAVGACTPLPPAQVQARLQELPAQFDRIAAEVHRRAPRARLIFLTYQTVLPPSGSCDRLGLDDAHADEMRSEAAALAAITRAAAVRNGADLYDAAATTAGHDVCAAQSWMTDRRAFVPLHTTLEGMTAIAQGLNQLLDAPR